VDELRIVVGAHHTCVKQQNPLNVLRAAALAFIFGLISCAGTGERVENDPEDLCACTPKEDADESFRRAVKDQPLPDLTPQDIDVATMLEWPQEPVPAADAPREGRELQMFRLPRAFLHAVFVVRGDCDLKFEVADTPDTNAPRFIVETPNQGYCPARRSVQEQLAQHGFTLTLERGGTPASPIPVEVRGLAFLDAPGQRGSELVKTRWELHPAIVTILP
jgi:hypothetical protein